MKQVLNGGKAKSQTARVNCVKRSVAIAVLLTLASAHATEEDVMDMLVCPHGSASAFERIHQTLESLKPVLIEQGDGHFRLPGVVRRRGVCVSDIEVVGAFDVLIFKGVLCEGSDWKALVRQAREASPTLKPQAGAEVGNALASLSDDVSQFSVSRGSSSLWPFPSSPNLDGNRLIYVCYLQPLKGRRAR